MKTSVLSEFSLQTTDFSSLESLPDLAVINEHFGMVLNVGPYRHNFINVEQPYRFVEGRILWVTGGNADIELNLEKYHMEKGDILQIAPESIIELKRHSEDYTMVGIICKQSLAMDKDIIHIHAKPEDWQETLNLAKVLWNTARRSPFRLETVSLLVAAIASEIRHINRMEQELHPVKRKSRGEEIFCRFKKLVNDNCCLRRNIPFYADKLALTPHYLSTLIVKVSGRSVMYWINRATLIQAKVLLKNEDLLIYEIAERLNFPSQSAFGLFFKRETGMSPGEYRKTE